MNHPKRILLIALGVIGAIIVGFLLMMPKQPFSPYEADLNSAGLDSLTSTSFVGTPTTLNFSLTNRTFFPFHLHLVNNINSPDAMWRQNNTWIDETGNCSVVSQTEFDCGTLLPGQTHNFHLTGTPKTLGAFSYSFSLINKLQPSDQDDAIGGIIYGANNKALTINYQQNVKILIFPYIFK